MAEAGQAIDQFILRADDPKIDQPAAFAAFKRLEGEHKRRIHQQGQGSTYTALGTYAEKRDPAGKYSFAYGAKRRAAGKSVTVKNLYYAGGLSRSYTTGLYQNRYAYGFLTYRSRLIAQGQQGQTRQEIFSLSDKERDLVTTIYAEQLVKAIFG